MEKIPDEWIDKLFTCMHEFYGDRWVRYVYDPKIEASLKLMWKNGLYGLTYDQIKAALKLCKRQAEDLTAIPPHVMEFFRYAKGYTLPHIKYQNRPDKRGDPVLARIHISEIKKKMRGYVNVDRVDRTMI